MSAAVQLAAWRAEHPGERVTEGSVLDATGLSNLLDEIEARAHAATGVPRLAAALRAVLTELDRVKDVPARRAFIHRDRLRDAIEEALRA